MRRAWIESGEAVAVVQQCLLAGVSRATIYAQQKPSVVDESELLHRRLIDEEYTRHPFYGSRRMVIFLGRAGKPAGRRWEILRHEGLGVFTPQHRHIKVRARTSQHLCTCHSAEGQVMTNIIQFPKRGNSPPAPDPPSPSLQPPHLDGARGKAILSLVKGVWVVTVLVWPLLKWIVSLDVLFQLIRMVHHWSTTGVYAIWTFLLHFAVLTALTCFVSLYKPKGI
jgi:hypothetical protein